MAKAKKKPLREEKRELEKKADVPGRRRHAVALCLILVIAAGVYANSLKGEFIWDDKDLILDNQYIKSWSSLPVVLTKDFFYSSQDTGKIGYYRPLITLSYMLDYRLWRLNPVGYHMTNIIFHCSNSLLVYLIVFFLSSSFTLSFLSSLLFAIHPIHTESVSWISGRTDVIAGFFFFASFFLYMYWVKIERWWWYMFSLVLFGFALLSKEMVMTLPALIMLYDYYFVAGREWGKMKGRIKYWAGYFILIILYSIVRFVMLKVETGNPHVEGLSRFAVVLTFGKGFLYYLGKLLVPFNLNAYVMLELGRFTQIGVWAGFILIGGLAVAGLRSQDRRISFGIGFSLISLLPLTNLIPISAPVDIDFPLAERFLYIPSFGFCLIQGVLIEKAMRLNTWMVGTLIFILLFFYSYNTVVRNRDWREEENFYQLTAQSSPCSSVIRNNLGAIFSMKGKYDEAIEYLRKAIELNPQLVEAHNNLGNAYQDKRFYREAMVEYQEALRLRPDHVKTHNNLGNLYLNIGRYDLAEQELRIALQSRLDFAETHNNLGSVYSEKGLYGDAMREIQKALDLKPDFAEAHNNLGSIYHNLKKYSEALQEFNEALRLKPDFAEPYYNLGNVYNELFQYQKAIQAYQQATKIKPLFTEASFNLGVLYTNLGLYKEAERAYLQALRSRLNYAPAHRNLGVIYLNNLKNRERAIYHLQMALQIEPNQVGADAIRRALKELGG
ncbi:MAG: tetratricopeptide repeat protein [Proteobacteria bacterium]|nr:tetratricopeptide repeat protein [Pseudomonadota bacterium]